MTGPLAIVALVLSALVAARRRRRRPARAVILSPRRSTVIASDGAVRSVQSAELTMAGAELERLWSAANLENLARTYWRFLTRVTLGLIRVVYGQHDRRVVLLGRPLTLLRFDAPDYQLQRDYGTVRWRIKDGLLVARGGRGCGRLTLEVRRESTSVDGQARLRIEVEVANFYPAIAAGFSMPVYEATQSAIHVLVTHAFLRSLAKLQLPESKVGRLASASASASVGPAPPGPDQPRGAEQPPSSSPRAPSSRAAPASLSRSERRSAPAAWRGRDWR